jgi:hypothetical protein
VVPERDDEELYVVSDLVEQYPSFFKILYCSLDYHYMLVYTMLFCQLEYLWGGEGNSLLSLFFVYLMERTLRELRGKLGSDNLCKKAFVDPRFLI